MNITREISNRVGWTRDKIHIYPSIEDVIDADMESLLKWSRFLRASKTLEELGILNKIAFRLFKE